MTIHSQYTSNVQSVKGAKLWDPVKILGIINSDPGYQCITCIGFAPSQRRRCRNPINASNRSHIFDVLEDLSYLDPVTPAVTQKLRSIAGSALCVSLHQGQAETVLQKWIDKIDELKALDHGTKYSWRNQNSTGRYVSSGALTSVSESFEAEIDKELQDLYVRMTEEIKRRQREEEKRQKEKRQREKKRLELEEAERQKREDEERRRRAKEQSDRQERARQKAEREAKERQRTTKKQEEWDQLWAAYEKKWSQFKTGELKTKSTRHTIPWPVRSGLYEDVKAESVKEFLRRATPKDVSMEKLMRKEARNWHSDTRNRLFHDMTLTIEDKEMMEMICRVVTDLLNESAQRSSGTL